MADYKREVRKLMSKADGDSDSDVAILEEAVRLADLHGDVGLGLQTRIRLIHAANFSGNHEVVLVAFTWCLAQLDRDDGAKSHGEWDVLWTYKWVINSLSEYAQVSRKQIEESFDDMAKRYKAAGFGVRAVHSCRANALIRLGDLEGHRKERKLWTDSPRDVISDCPACTTDTAVSFDLEYGDYAGAVKRAAPILSGRQTCAEVPCLTFGRLLLPMLKLGRAKEAEEMHARTIRQALSSRDFLVIMGEHAAYLALVGNISKAVSVFETGFSWFTIVRRTWDRMNFLHGAIVLFEQLAKNGDEPIPLKIPKTSTIYQNRDSYQPSVVGKALNQLRADLAHELNQRNGNDYMEQRHAAFRTLMESIT